MFTLLTVSTKKTVICIQKQTLMYLLKSDDIVDYQCPQGYAVYMQFMYSFILVSKCTYLTAFLLMCLRFILLICSYRDFSSLAGTM